MSLNAQVEFLWVTRDVDARCGGGEWVPEEKGTQNKYLYGWICLFDFAMMGKIVEGIGFSGAEGNSEMVGGESHGGEGSETRRAWFGAA